MVITYNDYTTTVSYRVENIPELPISYDAVYKSTVGDTTISGEPKYYFVRFTAHEIMIDMDEVQPGEYQRYDYQAQFVNGAWIIRFSIPSQGEANLNFEIYNITNNGFTLKSVNLTMNLVKMA